MQSPFFLFSIDWELRGLRTLWVRVANLAFLKLHCENLAFLTCLTFFQRPKKGGRNLAFSDFFWDVRLYFKYQKKQTKSVFIWLFFGIFQNNNARICSLRQCDPLTGSVMWQLPYVSALQPFLLWCTLKDILTNSCTLFTDTSPNLLAPMSVSTLA